MIQTLPLPPEDLRAQVAQHLPWARIGNWTPLFGGRTNCAWQIEARDGSAAAVLKRYRAPATNPLFPNDPQAEATLLAHLADQSIAPKLIAQLSSEHSISNLYQAIPGVRWTEGVKDVAELMQKLHQIAPPIGLRDIPNGSAALLDQADAILSLCEATDELTTLRPSGFVAPTMQTALLHCDIVPGNLIRNDNGLHLIDWQCPGVGDPCEDIATFLSPAMQILYRGTALSAVEANDFLSQIDPAITIRYRMLSRFYHYRTAAYCLWQSQQDRPDYALGLTAEITALETI